MPRREYSGLHVLENFAYLSNYTRERAVVHYIMQSPSEMLLIQQNLAQIRLPFINFLLELDEKLLRSERLYYENQVKAINIQGLHMLSLWLNDSMQETVKAISRFSDPDCYQNLSYKSFLNADA